MPAALKLDHVAMPIRDVAGTHRFYTEVLGLPLLAAHAGDDWGGREWLTMIFGVGDARQIILTAFRGTPGPLTDGLPEDARHIALAADSKRELQGWRQRLEQKGIAFREEDHGAQRSLYFKDPNGIILEVTAPASAAISSPPGKQAAETVALWLKGK
jgi:glyoxylase I family protein